MTPPGQSRERASATARQRNRDGQPPRRLPVLLAHESADEPDRQRLTAVFRGTVDPLAAHRTVLDVVTRTGALIKAVRQAHSYAERARAQLQGLAQAERLTELAESAAERQR